jgi:hypothetical protein
MNPFSPVSVRALENRLPQGMDADYYASNAFRARSSLQGKGALADQLRVTHYLLERIALDPKDVTQSLMQLEAGCVLLHFFGVSNPVPMFSLDPRTEESAQLRRAIMANINSPMFDAAKRTRKWREPARGIRRDWYIAKMRDVMRKSTPFPGPEEHRQDPQGARAKTLELCAQLDAYTDTVRERRHKRLAKLAQAAAPGLTSWHELLQDIAANVLSPAQAATH